MGQAADAGGRGGAPGVPPGGGGGSGDDGPLTLDVLRRVGIGAGLVAVGVTTADVLEPARTVIPLRRRRGLAGSMQFTYRNPDRSTDPGRILDGARSLVVGLAPHRTGVAPRPPGHRGLVARYAVDDAYGALRAGLDAIAAVIAGAGHRTRVVADSNALVDRNAAWRAGLGWWGKNANLLNAGHGSFVVIGAVVTDADVEPGAGGDPVPDGCGPCTACLDGCPTGALVAPGVLDARRCIAWLVQSAGPIPVELRPAVGDRLYGCDVCQEVCPPNRVVAGPRSVVPDDGREWVDVIDLLGADDAELLARHGRWYIADRDPDVIRRTALVILGNTGDPDDPAVVSALAGYLGHPNPVLADHAAWAWRQLGLGTPPEGTGDPVPPETGRGDRARTRMREPHHQRRLPGPILPALPAVEAGGPPGAPSR